VVTAIGPGQRSLYYIESELRRMRRQRIRLLKLQVQPMPAEAYAGDVVALINEAIALDPEPQHIDWSAHALGMDGDQ
jgi:hypothetical protein